MKINLRPASGFALIATLVMMALVVTVVVAYLLNSRTDRSTSSLYANRLRAKIVADAGLSAATNLLYQHTKTGNYITAMPAPVPPPTSIRTEIYRPDNTATADDFLKLNNALGDVLASRADTAALAAPPPQVDPRPTVTPIPAPATGGSFGFEPVPAFTAGNSYDFNQVVRVGANDTGRLVNPATPIQPAFGQWVRVRNSAGELVGRYAFFIEDESMKTNVNNAGNKLGTAGANLRVNDLAIPLPAATPATQTQEIDPSGVLPVAANRGAATQALADLGAAGNRVGTKNSVGLMSQWHDNSTTKLSDYAHTMTVTSSDDVTTARGWQRMDLNQMVANAGPGNAGKAAVAQKIADWIKDAWTGPVPLANFSQDTRGRNYQVYNDERLRRQLAANIVDYIDSDDIPTDMGQYPEGDPAAPAVIGIEKIPYLVEMDVVYTATAATPPTPGRANIAMKFRFNFFNMYEKDLRLSDYVGKITVKGVPVVNKNGAPIFDHEAQTYEVNVGGSPGITDAVIPAGGDNVANGVAGVKTFLTQPIETETVTFTPGGSNTRFEAGLIEVEVLGKSGERLDSVRIVVRDLQAKYSNASPQPNPNDFLEASQSAAAINASYEGVPTASGSITPISYGDPRYRPAVPTQRMYNLTRTDIARFNTSDDKAEIDSRAYAADWHDYIGNRPLAVIRNGPMVSVGELGNVENCEFPWRTVYLQYAGRPESTVDVNVVGDVQNRRGSSPAAQTNPSVLPQDYVLMDLFTTSQDKTRTGSINLNSQANIKNAAGDVEQGALISLVSALPIGPMSYPAAGQIGGTTLNANAMKIIATSIASRRVAVAPSASGGPGAPGGPPPIDNNPRRPYFTIGEVASVISRLINQNSMSPATTTGNGRARSTTVYSVLRASPNTASQWTRDYGDDQQVEEPFRTISNSITTRGNVFRVLFVGQAIKDQKDSSGNLGNVESPSEIVAEYLGEAFVERQAVFGTPTTVGSSSVTKTTDSKLKILAQRAITE